MAMVFRFISALLLALTLLPTPASAVVADTSDYLGSWEGTLKVGPTDLRVVFHLQMEGDSLTAAMDSPDQGASGIPVPDILVDADTLRLGIPSIAGMFAGVYEASGPSIRGQWVQGGQRFRLVLTPTDETTTVRRPQTPEPPFPYRTEDVTFRNRIANLSLTGTLSIPEDAQNVPGVVLVGGSGGQDRDGTLMGHKPLLVLADALTRQGVAVLRFDERGMGGSEGTLRGATTRDLSGDVEAAVETLAARDDVGPVGIAGMSEGGLIAPMVATRTDDVSFLVLLGTPGLPGKEVLLDQTQRISEAQGMPSEMQSIQRGTQERVFEALTAEGDSASVAKTLTRILQGTQGAPSPARIEQEVQKLMDPWFTFFLGYDPRPTLRQVDVPVLALTGSKDVQVAPGPNLEAIRTALASGKTPPHTVEEVDGVNHIFQPAETGLPSEYGRIEQTMAPTVLDRIGTWILDTTNES